METWNFHSYIALKLEHLCQEADLPHKFSADEIECGDFVEAMLQLLARKGIDNAEFKRRCAPYKGLEIGNWENAIPEKEAKSIFDDFLKLWETSTSTSNV